MGGVVKLEDTQWIRCVLAVGVLAAVAAGPSAPADETGTESDRILLLIEAPDGPVFVELRIFVEGQPYRLWAAERIAAGLDVDRSGDLSRNELRQMPGRLLKLAEIENRDAFLHELTDIGRTVEPDGSGHAVPRDLFQEWFAERLQRTMRIVAQPVPPASAVRLGVLLDSNGNGRVDPDELRNGLHTLRFRDLDDDQTLSASELLPFRDPRNQRTPVTPDAAALPFFQIDRPAGQDAAAARILRRYGDDTGRLPFSVLRTHRSHLSSADATGDRMFDASELRIWLRQPAVHLSWEFRLSEMSGRSRVSIQASPFARRFCRVQALRRGRVLLHVDDMPLEIRAHGGSGDARRTLRAFVGQHFSVADGDGDDHLIRDEFRDVQNSLREVEMNIGFDEADVNGDERLSRDELNAVLDIGTLAEQSQIQVSVRQDGRTLFSLLDVSQDRRLSRREMQEGQEVLQQHDTDGDGELAESELGTRYVLQIGLGQAEWQDFSRSVMMSPQMTSTDAIVPEIEQMNGPQWFRRMDRNRDGDLSRREFLGTAEQFSRIDTDQDELISAEEAAAASSD